MNPIYENQCLTTTFEKLGFESTAKKYNPIVFIEQDSPPQPSTQLPDTAITAEICSKYYPTLLSLHAPPDPNEVNCSTPGCQNTGPMYLCQTCFSSSSFCCECTKAKHKHLPFHKVNTWDESAKCYTSTSWSTIGMVFSFLHDDGTPCISQGTVRQLQTLNVNGIHEVPYYLCACLVNTQNRQTASATQLLANKLFPATSNSPSSAFTFELLEQFDALNLNGFINIKQFCDTITSLTPRELQNHNQVSQNCSINTKFMFSQAPGSLRANFHYAVRIWRLFRIMKSRSFRSYEELLSTSIVRGCPACPHPSINIPADWHKHPYRYAIIKHAPKLTNDSQKAAVLNML